MLVDSHCHLTDDRYQEDRWEAMARARAEGVGGIVTVASEAADAESILAFLREWEGRTQGGELPALWGTAGVHPHEAEDAGPDAMDRVREAATAHPRMVAIGETGLDFFYDLSPREVQEALFRDHLALAEALELPVVVHTRKADELTVEILQEWGSRVRGVLHCFTGGEELLRTALDVGWMVSFTGLITFKKYDGRHLLKMVPKDRLMVETDGPYLAPTPYRGKRNEPAFVRRVAETMAMIRNEDPEEVWGYTTENARGFFGLDL